jgi:hypothetical protein
MPADQQPRGKIRENHDTEQHIECFGDIVRWEKRRRDDEQDGDDIECQQCIAEANALRRRAFVKVSNGLPECSKRHGAIFTARALHCK